MVAKSAKPPPSMHIVQLRTQSFAKPIKVNNKTKLRWPHTRPIPEDLALAGFYYFPYDGADDNVCCYLCGKNMGDIFRRNALNLGLEVVQSEEAVADARDGDEFSFGRATRQLTNVTQQKSYEDE